MEGHHQGNLSLWRRFGRLVFRGLRPISAPIMHRFRLHVQRAVGLAPLELQIHALQTEMSRQMDAHRAEFGRALDVMSQFGSKAPDGSERLDRLQVGIDALRRDFHQYQASAIGVRVFEGITALLARADAFEETQANHFDVMTALLGRADGLREEQVKNFEMMTALLGRADGFREEQVKNFEMMTALLTRADSIDKQRAKSFELATIVLSRVDALLQRVSIPVGQELLMRTPYGFLLIPMEDRGLITGIWENGGLLEQGTVKVLTGLLKQGDQVIDVGANIGLLTLPAAVSVGPTCRVIAMEPGSRAFSLLRESLAINFEAGRVNLQNCAAGAAAGKATLNLGQHIGHSSLLALDADEGKEEVEVVPLDALTTPGQRVDLVKIDVEGFELEVWRGMARIIADNPDLAVIVELGPEHLQRAGVTIKTWLAELRRPGFVAFEIDEASGVVAPLRSTASLQAAVSLNLLLLRKPPSAYPQLTFK